MTKEIIVNAGEMESRVAILENGRLMELHVEREPKIVGNIYKGRVTKVLKGMDAAFVDIGIELNAFLSVSDVVAQDEEEASNGRVNRRELPPITELLHANQEILVQVVRAPMGTKGARITTRLSVPGRYMVLMLNSGGYVGVSRKIEDPEERQRLRALANSIKPENYSVIVRTEAEGKSEEELRQDLTFLLEMAARIEAKAAHSTAPALVHGDLNLILRLIRDAFTRDVNRVVVDTPSGYENVLELVEMISPHLKNRIFLYDEPLPVFHAYNIELEIERTLRRKVWLPSGGHLVFDQAEALIAIDVNTGRFVGSVELAETVLTTNLQAAEEVARQLRLRDVGGIIVVDFIDMDNPKHRQQVSKVFEEALKRDRAKIKVHNISPLGLVEMTRKRTGESLAGLLTEPCPYCSGIGRVQNPLTVALRVQRDLAAMSVEHPETEAFFVTAHPRVIASVLGYEGEIHGDLEHYVGRPVYLRNAEDYHPNTYQLEHLTLEQAMMAVPHLEDGEIVEGLVVNPDPALAMTPLLLARNIYVIVPELDAPVGARVKVKIRQAGTSLAFAEPLAEELRGIRGESRPPILERPPLVPMSVLPPYLREERTTKPPRELRLLSPTIAAVSLAAAEAAEGDGAGETPLTERRYPARKGRRGRRLPAEESGSEAPVENRAEEIAEDEQIFPAEAIAPPMVEATGAAEAPAEQPLRRRRSRRRGRRGGAKFAPATEQNGEETDQLLPNDPFAEAGDQQEFVESVGDMSDPFAETDEEVAEAKEGTVEGEAPVAPRRRRRRGGRRTRHAREMERAGALASGSEAVPPEGETTAPEAEGLAFDTEIPLRDEQLTAIAEELHYEPALELLTPEAANEALQSILNAIPEPEPTAPADTEITPTPVEIIAPEALLTLFDMREAEPTPVVIPEPAPLVAPEPEVIAEAEPATVLLEMTATEPTPVEAVVEPTPARRKRTPRARKVVEPEVAPVPEEVATAPLATPEVEIPVVEAPAPITEPLVPIEAAPPRRRRAPRKKVTPAPDETPEE